MDPGTERGGGVRGDKVCHQAARKGLPLRRLHPLHHAQLHPRHRPLLPPRAPLHFVINYPSGISAAPPLAHRERVRYRAAETLWGSFVEADYLSEVLDALVPPAAPPSSVATRK